MERNVTRMIMLAALVASGCDDRIDHSLEMDPPEGGVAAWAAKSIDVSALTSTGAQITAVRATDGSKVGVALGYRTGSGGAGVGFFAADEQGQVLAPVESLTESALAAGGVAIAKDRVLGRFYVAWIEATGARLHLETLGDTGERISSQAVVLPGVGTAANIDLAIADNVVLVAGIKAPRTLFLYAVDPTTGDEAAPMVLRDLTDGSQLSASFLTANGSCEDCVVAVRDLSLPRPSLGFPSSPAIGYSIGKSTSYDAQGHVTGTSYILGREHPAIEAGDFPRVGWDGTHLSSVALADSGKIRMQAVEESCGAANPFQGCVSPSSMISRNDLAANELGGAEGTKAVAIGVDSTRLVYALSDRGSGGRLIFGVRSAPWTATGKSAGPFVHTLSGEPAGDPSIVRGDDGWIAVWAEGDQVQLAPLK